MPIITKMMKNLQKEYGKEKGKSVYYALENKQKTQRRRRLRKHNKKR